MELVAGFHLAEIVDDTGDEAGEDEGGCDDGHCLVVVDGWG